MAEKAPRLLNINGLDRQHMMLFVRKGTAYTLARRWTCASFHTCTISCSAPRTVLLNAQERVSVAQVLQEHCSNEAGSFVVARDEYGVPFSLGDKNYRNFSSLKFLPFHTEDKLPQRTFWLSTAYVLTKAVSQACTGPVFCGTPNVHERSGDQIDATSGFSLELMRMATPRRIERSDLLATQLRVDDTLQNLAWEQQKQGVPKLAPEELEKMEQYAKQMCNKSSTFHVSYMPWEEAFDIFAENPLILQTVLGFGASSQHVPVVYIDDDPVGALPSADDVLLRRTKPIKAIKLTGWSTATMPRFRESSNLQPLVYVRGISFPGAQDLHEYTSRLNELEKSDHRHLGMAQSLFFAHDSSPGSPFVLPHGMRLLRKVERVIRDLYDAFGYEEVQTPQLFRSSLWKQSGHWDKYREDMFSAQGFSCCGAHNDVFGLKPMNCPGHCVMFSHQPRSYRDLPMRLAEFSPLHRNEASGALSGLTRVRRFHQDDAHVFCTPSQVSEEIESMLHMLSLAYRVFGFGDRFELVLSTRPENYLGQVSAWDQAEASLKEALDASGKTWSLNEGDGAFYGPKIDIRLVDAMGRKHQTATIQLDFQLPERFKLEYAQPLNSGNAYEVRPGYARPVMIHRAILGSFERFLAILVEQCKGWWPFWLSPRQAVVIPAYSGDADTHHVVSNHAMYVQHVLSGSTQETRSTRNPFLSPCAAHHTLQVPTRTRFQVELPPHYLMSSGDTLGKKVRQAQLNRYNFVIIVGPQEAQNGTVSLRMRDEKAAPAWHAGADAPHTASCKVYDLTWAVLKATFPDRFTQDVEPCVNLGTWEIPDLRRFFAVLDALHV